MEGETMASTVTAGVGFLRAWGLRLLALATGVAVLVVSDGHGLACPCAGCTSVACLIVR